MPLHVLDGFNYCDCYIFFCICDFYGHGDIFHTPWRKPLIDTPIDREIVYTLQPMKQSHTLAKLHSTTRSSANLSGMSWVNYIKIPVHWHDLISLESVGSQHFIPGTLRTLVLYQKWHRFGRVIAQTRGQTDSTYFISVKYFCSMNLYVLTRDCIELFKNQSLSP